MYNGFFNILIMKKYIIYMIVASTIMMAGCDKENDRRFFVVTAAANEISANAATLGGSIVNGGTLAFTERGVCYATTVDPTTDNNKTPIEGTDIGGFSVSVSGLTPNTVYYVRAYVVHAKGTVYGNGLSFRTSEIIPETLPTLITTEARNITRSNATLGGNIADVGYPAYWERGICYATTAAPTTDDYTMPVEGAGVKGNFSVVINELDAGTTYYAKAYAINDVGTAYGEQVSFTTMYLGEAEMVLVNGGTFTMGKEGIAIPEHEVTLSSFYIGKYEVTQEQWETLMGINPAVFKSGGNYPIEQVSWNDIAGTGGNSMEINGITYYEDGFIYKLNALTGKNYRLPTEAEWEYAAGGGSKSNGFIFSGSNVNNDVAWYAVLGGTGTHPIGEKLPNELDIYDMSGNVAEWCSDWLGDYSSEPQTNPTGPETGATRICRGGGWDFGEPNCRVSDRLSFDPNLRSYNIGFRLVLSAE